MAGLAEMIGMPQVSKAIDPRRNMLLGLAAGLVGGPTWGQGLSNGFQLAAQGGALDQQAAEKAKAELKVAQQTDAFKSWLSTKRPDLVPLLDAGVSSAELVAKAQLDERNKANAAFLKDPTLQQLVTSGAIDFKDAYEMETGTGGDFGQAIIPGFDESTRSLVPMRADPRGGLSIAAMPEGIKYAPDALAGARAGGTIDGKTMANARAALPGAEQTVQITLDAVDTLRNDKQGQAEMFNGFNRYFGSTKGTPMANFEVNLNQASGQAFMQARQMLKGGGQITDFEGRRAEAAFSRLSDAASQGDLPTFLAALDDFEMAVTEGYRKLQAVANGTYQPTTSLPGGGSGSADPLNLFGGQ